MDDATHGSGAPEATPSPPSSSSPRDHGALVSPPLVAAAWPSDARGEWPADDAPPIEWARFYARRLGWVVRPTAGEYDRWSYARKLERDAFADIREMYRRGPTEDERTAVWDEARDIADKASRGPIGFIKCPANADECDEAYLERCWGGKHGHERGICIMPGQSSRGFPMVLVDVDVDHSGQNPPGDLDGPWGAGLPGPKSRTPRGGMHTLLLAIGGERSSGGRIGLAPGVDVIGCGGTPINVPAGSATPDRRWTSKAPPVVAPEALRRPPMWRDPARAAGAGGTAGGTYAWDGPGAAEGGSGRAAEAMRAVHGKGERGRACGVIVGMLARRGALPEDVVAAALEVLAEDLASRDRSGHAVQEEMDRWRRLLTRGPRDEEFAIEVIQAWSQVRDGEAGRRRWSHREARMQARSHWRTVSRRQEGEVGTEDHAYAAEGVGEKLDGASPGASLAGAETGQRRDRLQQDDVLGGRRHHQPEVVGSLGRGDVVEDPLVAVEVEADPGDAAESEGRGADADGAADGLHAERKVDGHGTAISDNGTVDGDHAGKVAPGAYAPRPHAHVPPTPPSPPAAPEVDVVASAPAKDVGARIDESRLRRLLPTLGQAYTREDRLKDYARRPLSVDVLYPFADFRTGQPERDPGPGHGVGAAFSRAIGGISAGSAKVFGAPSGKSGKSHFLGQIVEGLALCTAARIIGDPSYANAPVVLPVWISEMPIKGEAWLRMIGRHCGFDFKAIRDGELAEDVRGVQHMANQLQWTAYDVVRRARALADFYDDHSDDTALGFALKYLVRQINLSVLPRAKGAGHFREDPRAGAPLMDYVADAVALHRRDLASLLGLPEDKVQPVVLLDPCQHYAGDGASQKSAIDALLAAAHTRICGSDMGIEGILLATSDTTKAATKEMPLAVFLSEAGKRLAVDVFAGSAGIIHRFDAAVAMSSEEPPAGVLSTTQYLRVLLGRDGSPAEVYPCDWEMHTGRFRARPAEPLRPPVDPDDRPGSRSGGHGRAGRASGPGVGDDPRQAPRRYGTPPRYGHGRTDD